MRTAAYDAVIRFIEELGFEPNKVTEVQIEPRFILVTERVQDRPFQKTVTTVPLRNYQEEH